MTSSPKTLFPASVAAKSRNASPSEFQAENPTMSPHTYTPSSSANNSIFRMPESMCWLCRREIEATRRDPPQPIPRPALCRIISFCSQYNTKSHSSSPVSISGIGYRLPASAAPCGRIAFLVPLEPDHPVQQHSCPQTGELQQLKTVWDEVYSQSDGSHRWTFRVHADCWDLVESRTENIQACALAWCRALACLNWNFTPFSPGMSRYDLPKILLIPAPPNHGLPALNATHKRRTRRNNRKSLVGMQRLPDYQDLASQLGLVALPTVVAREGIIPLSSFNLYTPDLAGLVLRNTETAGARDVFSNLPEEILQHIIRHTRTADLLNFRLASRVVAYVSHLGALPRSFWLSRFKAPFELSFALPVDVDMTLDWRALYFLIRRALTEDSEVLSHAELPVESPISILARRKYWWGRFADVSSVDLEFGSRASLSGEPFSWPCPPTCTLSTTGLRPRCDELWSLQMSSSKSYVGVQLTREGGRQRYHSTVSMTLPHSSSMAAVGISTVRLCGQSYISGLQFFKRDDPAPESLGYVFGHSQTIVRLGEGDLFVGFGVRLDGDAVRSLRVVYQTRSGGHQESSWIGDVEYERTGLNPATADLQSSTWWVRRDQWEMHCTLAASFDHFRMLAIGLIETPPPSPPPDENNPRITAAVPTNSNYQSQERH